MCQSRRLRFEALIYDCFIIVLHCFYIVLFNTAVQRPIQKVFLVVVFFTWGTTC